MISLDYFLSFNSGEKKKTLKESVINDNFIKQSLADKMFHIHSEIDLWINMTIMELLNYDKLLGEESSSFIKKNKKYNYTDIEENINKEKLKILSKISEGTIHEKSKNEKNSILGYESPNCEIYFIVKLFVDDRERQPNYQTKIIFNIKNINQSIPFKFKYKDLTEESYIVIEIYTVELAQKDSFLGKAKIFLFDKNLNLYQGRHSIKISKNLDNDNITYTEIEKEIDLLINSFYGKEFTNSENYYGEGKDKEGIKIKNSKKKIEEIKNNYYYNLEAKEPQIKTELMNNYESKLLDLLEKTNDSFIIIRFPSFKCEVIFEEKKSDNFKESFTFQNVSMKNIWVFDDNIYKDKNLVYEENPVTKRLEKLNPIDTEKINNLLNTPDFIDLKEDKEIFWKNRYELKRNCTHDALTKILNAVNWNNKENYNEFLKNILKSWKPIEMCDILYILSRKFSVNRLFMDNKKIKDLEGLKNLRKYAIHKLKKFSSSELNFILLQLVQAIKYENISIESFCSPLVKLLIEKSKDDLGFASSFYWFIECESSCEKNEETVITCIFSKIKEYFLNEIKVNKVYYETIKSEIDFKKELGEISRIVKNAGSYDAQKKKLTEMIDKERKNYMHNTSHYVPIEPKIKVKGIFTDDCTVFSSSTRPIKYTFRMEEKSNEYNRFGNKNYYEFIFKIGDDLRQDQLILQMINFMNSLLKKQYINCEFTPYKALATSKDDGFLEFVPNAITYYDIKKKYKELKLYFKSITDNPEQYKQKLEKFINSLAGYCAVNYILGVGDRHDHNVMFRKDGHIFHIDFGYILENEPYWNFIPFKISKDMVDFMGGKDSENYKKFTQKCVNVYLELRESARSIINMFYLMIDSGIPQLNNIECLKKFHERFNPGLTKEEAKNKFLKELDESLNSFTSEIKEKFHKWKQDLL